jgi:hypothetical protein
VFQVFLPTKNRFPVRGIASNHKCDVGGDKPGAGHISASAMTAA